MKQSSAALAFSDALLRRHRERRDWVRLLDLVLALTVVVVAVWLRPAWEIGTNIQGAILAWAVVLAWWLSLPRTSVWKRMISQPVRVRVSVAFEQLIEQLPLVVYVDAASDNSANLYTSPQVEAMLGYTVEEWKADPDLFVKLLHPDDRERVLAHVRETNSSGARFSSEYRLRARDGRIVWVLDESTHIVGDDGQPMSAQGFMLDITRRREAEERLQKLAWTDELTGLPNRANLISELNRRLAVDGSASLVFLDLDDFKTVNDSLGHAAGDQLLASTAERLRASLRDGDLVARLGGDEFAILTSQPVELRGVALRALAAVTRPHGLFGYDIRPTASAGIASGTDVETILRDADLAMYAAKGEGGGTLRAFAPSMLVDARARLVLSGELRRPELLDELVLHYQPTFDLRSGRIEALEALVRWEHPTRGLLPPGEFIEHAEKTGAIDQIGRWAIAAAVAQLATWQEELGLPPRVAVNISTVQLGNPALLGELTSVLLEHRLPPEALRLELTESALLRSDDDSRSMLRSIGALGVQLALDDFGAGHSSVGYLENLPFSILKIDKSFLDNPQLDESPLLRGIVALARAMGLAVVAEGIERPDQLAAVNKLRCEIGQGFLLGRPVPPEEIGELLRVDRLPRKLTQLQLADQQR